jgi:hypothetical protein
MGGLTISAKFADSDSDDSKLDALEAEIDALVERIAAAIDAEADDEVLACEAQVDQLLEQIDQLLGSQGLGKFFPSLHAIAPTTLH